MISVVILISGRGSNMEAIIAATKAAPALPVTIKAVISNRPDAAGLATAAAAGLETRVVDHKAFADRAEFDVALGDAIAALAPDFVVMAGFMRVMGEAFVARFHKRILNIHPSLLPAFAGLKTHEAALAAGVRFAGATVHFVTPVLDSGATIIQAAVPVVFGDTPQTLAARVLTAEHQIYPQALKWLAEGRVTWQGDVLRVAAPRVNEQAAISPPLDV